MKLKDKKIQILEPRGGEGETDDSGFPIPLTWEPIHPGTLWAHYRQLSGKEFFASATVNQTEEVCFIVNWRADIGTHMIILFRGKFYEITRIDDFEGYKTDLNIYAFLSPDQDITIGGEA